MYTNVRWYTYRATTMVRKPIKIYTHVAYLQRELHLKIYLKKNKHLCYQFKLRFVLSWWYYFVSFVAKTLFFSYFLFSNSKTKISICENHSMAFLFKCSFLYRHISLFVFCDFDHILSSYLHFCRFVYIKSYKRKCIIIFLTCEFFMFASN
jgi:hypothetical protein